MHDNIWRICQCISLVPRKKHKIEVKEYSEQLSEKKGDLFHLVVEKLLFMMKTSRPDLETATSFLTTRVSNSDRFVHFIFKEKGILARQT